MSVETIELRNKAGQSVQEARRILDQVKKEKREPTADENTKVDALMDDGERLVDQATRTERLEAREKYLGERTEAPELEAVGDQGKVVDILSPEAKAKASLRAKARVDYIRHGLHDMAPNLRNALQQDNDIGGGFFSTGRQMADGILGGVDAVLPFRALTTNYKVARGTTLGQITRDGDVGEFEFGSGELTSATEDTGLLFGMREFRPRDMKKKLIKVSLALLQNASIDVEAYIAQRVGYALAKGLERAYMVGEGAFGPLGIFTPSADGLPTSSDVATGSATGVTADGLFDIQNALNDAYDNAARWLVHKDFVKLVRKLKDGNGVYVWQPGLQLGVPNQILGKEYIKGTLVPNTYTNGLYCCIYGDFSGYVTVDAINLAFQRLVELYALTGQIGFLFSNCAADGGVVLAEKFVRGKCATS